MYICRWLRYKITTDCILSSNTKLTLTDSAFVEDCCAGNFVYLNREKTDNIEFSLRRKNQHSFQLLGVYI